MVKTTGHLKLPRLSHQVSKLVKTIKKRTDITGTTRVIKKPAFTQQKNRLEQKKKQTEINTKKNLKQPRLLNKKNSLKRTSRNVKTKSKIVRNSKKSTLVPFTSEIVEERLPQDVNTTNMPPSISRSTTSEVGTFMSSQIFTSNYVPPSATITVTDEESRYVSQSTQTPIAISQISKTSDDQNKRHLPLGTITTNISSQISRTDNDENRRQLPITAKISSKIPRTGNDENRRQLPITANISSKVYKTGNKKNTRQLPRGTIIYNNSPQISQNGNKESRKQLPQRTIISNNSSQVSRNNETGRQLPPGTLISNIPLQAPDMRIITPSTAVAPAIVIHDQPSSSNIQFLTGFDRNLEPSHIIHIVEINKQMYFMMKWKGTSKMDLVPAEIVKERCPQLVIRFYESRLKNVFHSSYR